MTNTTTKTTNTSTKTTITTTSVTTKETTEELTIPEILQAKKHTKLKNMINNKTGFSIVKDQTQSAIMKNMENI